KSISPCDILHSGVRLTPLDAANLLAWKGFPVQGLQAAPGPTTPLAAPRPGRLRAAIHYARRRLLGLQKPDGHWVGELQGDTILQSEYVLLMAFLGRADDPRVRKAANYLLNQQQPAGGWSNYPDGPADVSVSVKAYFALKLAGHSADEPC